MRDPIHRKMQESLYDLLVKAALAVRTLAIDMDDDTFLVPAKSRLLARIRLDGTSTVKSLAHDCGVTPPVVSRMLAKFERWEWVERKGRRRPGRPVVLTHYGRIVRQMAGGEVMDSELRRYLSERDVAELKRLLRLVLDARRRYPRGRRTY